VPGLRTLPRLAAGLAGVLVLQLAVSGRAAATLRMSATDRAAIGNLVDRFVKDAVLRRDLAAAWKLAGPDLRGGTTYKAWVAATAFERSTPRRGPLGG
jgi:hypothetical protein